MTMHIGEAEVSSLVAVGQAFMVNPHEMKEGGMEIMHMHFVVADDVGAEVIGCSVDQAALDAAPGHPDRETCRVMIASVIVSRQFAL